MIVPFDCTLDMYPLIKSRICLLIIFIFTECSLEYALEAASLHPAKALGIDDRKGKLNFGCDADFVILNPEKIKIESTWIAGECVYKCDKKWYASDN